MPTLQFKGKTFVQNHHLAVPYHQLVPQKDKSLTNKISLNDNLIIHGDNLLALKALLPTYAGKVKCIYIDPPYNTGKENWVYNDNINAPWAKEWVGKIVGKQEEDFNRHDKWLCMMMPRLRLLKELLKEDGLIFISIDDNEVHHLKSLLNEVFGENNFIAQFVWVTDGNFDNQAKIKVNHEYILLYSNRVGKLETPPVIDLNIDEDSKLYQDTVRNTVVKNGPKNPVSSIVIPSGFPSDFSMGEIKVDANEWPKLSEPIMVKNHKTVNEVSLSSGWSSRNLLLDFIDNGFEAVFDTKGQETRFVITKNGTIEAVKVRSENQSHVLSVLGGMGNTQSTSTHLSKFGIDFDYPKPVKLIKYLIQLCTTGDDIVLDSFAGSGTTAEAVIDSNRDDEQKRKFILVECEDYADTITAERIRLLIKNQRKSTFSYFELGDAIEMESLLSGKSLPTYAELARYLFYTATGEEFKQEVLDEKSHFIGSTKDHKVYAYYKPDLQYLKTTALTLDEAKMLRAKSGNTPLLVFAPTKYIEQQTLDELNITFCQLPFEIYRMKK